LDDAFCGGFPAAVLIWLTCGVKLIFGLYWMAIFDWFFVVLRDTHVGVLVACGLGDRAHREPLGVSTGLGFVAPPPRLTAGAQACYCPEPGSLLGALNKDGRELKKLV